MEFLESPHATTEVSLAEQDQVLIPLSVFRTCWFRPCVQLFGVQYSADICYFSYLQKGKRKRTAKGNKESSPGEGLAESSVKVIIS